MAKFDYQFMKKAHIEKDERAKATKTKAEKDKGKRK